MMRRFPDGFLWGAAASAYQIEGAVREDGRGPSVWDDFCRIPGAVANGETGDVACDHYHRWPEDIALLKRLGAGAYRLSVAWPRVLPEGRGRPNRPGLDFYDRLVDALLEAGVEPWVCLHHWDMPSAMELRGGWRSRDVVHWFADYAGVVVTRLGDRVRRFAPINEPNVLPLVAYAEGAHAPGRQGRDACLAAMHHLNLAHGVAARTIKEIDARIEVGLIVSLGPVVPREDDARHQEAASLLDCIWRRVMADPVMLGRYPEPLADEIEPSVQSGDMALIGARPDWFGLNHYNRMWAAPDPERTLGVADVGPPPGRPTTAMGWEIDASAFLEQMLDVEERYGNPKVFITENGAAFPDRADPRGRVEDHDRVEFLDGYLGAVHEAIGRGCDIKGYFVWSLLDNFEWAEGYDKRFGLVRVQPGTLERVPKRSFDWYAEVIGRNALA